MASVVPKPWWRLLEIRNEGGRKNSEVVFSTSDVEKISSEVEFSISELFCFRPFSCFFDPRAVSRCGYWEASPSGTEIVAAFPLWRKTYCRASPLWAMIDDVGEIYLIFNF